MRDALPALGFLLALVIAPFFVTVGTTWSILHFTDTGLLVGGGEIATVETKDEVRKELVMCSYFTAGGFVERAVEHKRYGYQGQRNCPWRISVSA